MVRLNSVCQDACTAQTMSVEQSPDSYCSVDLLIGRIWLVHTKSRHEKVMATELSRKGISYYLPLVRTARRYQGRTVHFEIPLFPSYLFMGGDEEDRYAALMTHRATNIIRVNDQQRLRNELRHIHLATQSETPVDLYPGLKKGRRCRVVKGPLSGLEGTILRRRDLCRLYVGVEALGQSAELEIDASLIDLVD
jgi:transcription antitermination factor NusG